MTDTNNKYSDTTINDLKMIGDVLLSYKQKEKIDFRSLAARSNLSVNSVKSVVNGKTGNIASYATVAEALGTTLLDACVEAQQSMSQVAQDNLAETLKKDNEELNSLLND